MKWLKSFLCFSFPVLSFYALRIRYLVSRYLFKIGQCYRKICNFHFNIHFLSIRLWKEDLVETTLIESLLHQLYIHCEGRARGGQSLRVSRILYLSETDCLEWDLESRRAPRVTETMLRNARLVVVPTDGWAFSWQAGPGNAVIIWKYNSFTCCTHLVGQVGSMLNSPVTDMDRNI